MNTKTKIKENFFKKIIFKIADPITSKIKSLKNKHHGESCYIFGDGISIKWFDLSAFSDKPGIFLNKIIFHKQSKFLNIKYGIFLEPWYFYPYFWDRLDSKKILNDGVHKIFRKVIKERPDISFFTNLSNYPVLWEPNIFYLFKTIQDSECKFFEECYLSGENIYQGSIKCSISLAIYMGFKEVFLVGCDYTHEKSRTQHWYEKGEGKIKLHHNYQKNFFDIASKYIKITTVTLDGKSDILPSITYSDFTGKQASFKENQDLIDISIMNALHKSPWYNIFKLKYPKHDE